MNQQEKTIGYNLRHPRASKHRINDGTDLTNVSIVIIGAGISGLATAELLCSQGFSDVTIVEGSNKIGGRIFTTQLDNGPKLEIGAQYIHGSRKNPIYKLAKNAGISLVFELDVTYCLYTNACPVKILIMGISFEIYAYQLTNNLIYFICCLYFTLKPYF